MPLENPPRPASPEREKSLADQLHTLLNDAREKLAEENLTEDTETVVKAIERFNRFIGILQQLSREGNPDTSDILPLAYSPGNGGGVLYSPAGGLGRRIGPTEAGTADFQAMINEREQEGGEFLNSKLTPAGETTLLRVLGVLEPDQDVSDLTRLLAARLEEEHQEEEEPKEGESHSSSVLVEPNNHSASFPTNVPGVTLEVHQRQPTVEGFTYPERLIVLRFDDEFLRQIIPD